MRRVGFHARIALYLLQISLKGRHFTNRIRLDVVRAHAATVNPCMYHSRNEQAFSLGRAGPAGVGVWGVGYAS